MNIRGAHWFTPAILVLLYSVPASPQSSPPSAGNKVTFKTETNLVLVPVVMRDARGDAVSGLHKEDFQLFDNGKVQPIASFTVEETSGQVAEDRNLPAGNAPSRSTAAPTAQAPAAPMVMPAHFVALLFDDQHFKIASPDPPPGYVGDLSDLWYARDAALKLLNTLQPADRVAIFTTSGELSLDFTADRAKIREALSKLRPGKPVLPTVAGSNLAQVEIANQTRDAVVRCQDVVRRMSFLPGRRTMVYISPGLLLYGNLWSEVPETMQLIDSAIRSRVVINSLDARGLAAQRMGAFQEFQARVTDGTGGTYIRDTNDIDGAVHRLAATPKYIYVLGFSPEALKPDGSFHKLTVKLQNGHRLDLQARKGYWAPDAKELARKRNEPVPADNAATPRVSEAETREVAQALGIAPAQTETPPSAGNQVTFKAETNLVLVPVVVRDAKGDVVGGLRKDDFELLDEGRPQAIASFSVEETSGKVAEDRSLPGSGVRAAPMAMPDHYAALVFDDAHLANFDDVVYSRRAALKYLDTLRAADRVAMFTASGQFDVDFTSDRAKLREALMKLAPGPPAFFYGMPAEQVARSVISQCDKIIRRMSLLPGQRTMVLITTGLPIRGTSWDCVPETMRLIDHAIRSRVVIGSLDARGLGLESPTTRAWEFQLRVTDGTGGTFVRDTNDMEGAVQRLAAVPKCIYVLGFSPDMEKPDGSFHRLTVKLRNGRKLDIQARSGYNAPGGEELARKQEKPAPAAKAEAPRLSEAETKEVAQALGIVPAATPPAAPAKNDEIVTRDEAVTFKVQSNLVEVPVIARDRDGHAVGNLRQEDFRVFDKGKRQEITKFSVVKAAGQVGQVGQVVSPAARVPAPNVSTGAISPPVLPDHFVAFVFDDVHVRAQDLPQVRAAVVKYIRFSLGPHDRVALYTTSGRNSVDFTDRPEQLSEALLKISSSPMRAPDFGSCGQYVSFFQAVQIDQQVGLQATQQDLAKCLALRVAVADFGDLHTAMQAVRDAYSSGLEETRVVLAALKIVVQRMAAAPGQRSVVLVSPGFFVPPDLQDESSQLAALAIRSKVLISSVDARGVWTNQVYDPCKKGASAETMRDETAFRDLEGHAETDELTALAEDTGGTVNLNNDFDGGIRKAAAAPEYLYVLGFTPQNLKLDGLFHSLKVTVSSGEKVTLQARRGYWAPKHREDEMAVSRKEIEDAVFSRDEIHNLAVDMHTQVTEAEGKAKLKVLTSVDLKSIRLRKAEDRNRNDVTIVACLFDPNGNFIAGTEKILQLRLRDETVGTLEEKPPIVLATDFDVKAGGYLVRLVARDAEGQQITAENAAVQVP